MNPKKVLFLSDISSLGSGYRNITLSLADGMSKLGHDVKVLGLGYKGEEHYHPFSLIPTAFDPNIFVAQIQNLSQERLWGIDVLIFALDIPVQAKYLAMLGQIDTNFLTFGITAIESVPLSRSYAATLARLDKAFIISEFGTAEAKRHGIDAVHIPIGIDAESWRMPTPEERKQIRFSFGFSEDDFVILTVADNQERKFLSRTAQIVRDFKNKYNKNIRWILHTRPEADVGWNIPDLVSEMDLVNELMLLRRGMSFPEFWAMYASADCFLLTSKAEGLGMPVIEAMAVGLPVAATNCTGIRESISKGGGYPIEPEKLEDDHIDPFGNSNRYFASTSSGVQQLYNIWKGQNVELNVRKGRAYAETLKWDNCANLLDKYVRGDILDETNNG